VEIVVISSMGVTIDSAKNEIAKPALIPQANLIPIVIQDNI